LGVVEGEPGVDLQRLAGLVSGVGLDERVVDAQQRYEAVIDKFPV
jgi:hypothetical protein